MFKIFYQILQDNHLLDSNKKVLLAVSGGVDSIVLLHFMKSIPHPERPQISIAHVNHQLRKESDIEENFVKNIARNDQIQFYSYRWEEKDHPSVGIEEAARIERYSFFKKIMTNHQINYLMTGHHLDDQVETVLMRLTRGASLNQLLGIRLEQRIILDDKDGYLIRPLLIFSKEEIYQFADENRLEYVEDETNQELDFTRNRFRNEIIPLLKNENEKFNGHVEQFASDLSDLLEISQEPINRAYDASVHSDKDIIKLNLKKFKHYSRAIQRSVITKILEKVYLGEAESYKTNYIDLICSWLIEGEVNTFLNLIGSYRVEKSYFEAVFMKKNSLEEKKTQAETSEFKIEDLNQWIKISETESIGLFLREVTEDTKESLDESLEFDELLISEANLHLPLRIRHREAGDRMSYKGLAGRKKIKNIFIDDKTPPKEREEAWIIEDNKGLIIWLISHRKMDLFTEQETDRLLYGLKYIKK